MLFRRIKKNFFGFTIPNDIKPINTIKGISPMNLILDNEKLCDWKVEIEEYKLLDKIKEQGFKEVLYEHEVEMFPLDKNMNYSHGYIFGDDVF